jgi:hypothetical protein
MTDKFMIAPSAIRSNTTPRPYWLSAAWPSTRDNWFDTRIATKTPVTASQVCTTSRNTYLCTVHFMALSLEAFE